MKYDNPEHESFPNANILNPDTEVPFHDEQTISIDENLMGKLVPAQTFSPETYAPFAAVIP